MAQGTVKWFSDEKGYGFITLDEGGADLFVHYTGIAGEGSKSLEEGDKVSYEVFSEFLLKAVDYTLTAGRAYRVHGAHLVSQRTSRGLLTAVRACFYPTGVHTPPLGNARRGAQA